MRRISLIAVALVGLVVMAAKPGAVDNVLRYMKGGFQVGPSATLSKPQHKVTSMLAVDVDFDFASQTTTCVDSDNITLAGAKVGDPCFVGIGPGDGGVAIVTANSNFTAYVSAADVAKIRFCAAGTAANPADAGYQVRCVSSR